MQDQVTSRTVFPPGIDRVRQLQNAQSPRIILDPGVQLRQLAELLPALPGFLRLLIDSAQILFFPVNFRAAPSVIRVRVGKGAAASADLKRRQIRLVNVKTHIHAADYAAFHTENRGVMSQYRRFDIRPCFRSGINMADLSGHCAEGGDALNGAEQRDERRQIIGRHIQHGACIFRVVGQRIRMPGLNAEISHVRGDEKRLSDDARVQVETHALQSGGKKCIRRAADHHAFLVRKIQDLLRFLQRRGKRLLAEQIPACFYDFAVQGRVKRRRRQVDDNIQAVVRQKFIRRAGLFNPVLFRVGSGRFRKNVRTGRNMQIFVKALNYPRYRYC